MLVSCVAIVCPIIHTGTNEADIPQALISAMVTTKVKRKEFLASEILKQRSGIIGVYKLIMQEGSDNFHDSAVFDVFVNTCGVMIATHG